MRKKGENKTEKEEMKKGRKILSICLGLFSFMNVYVRVCVRVVCLCVGMHTLVQVLTELSRGCQIPWSYSYR